MVGPDTLWQGRMIHRLGLWFSSQQPTADAVVLQQHTAVRVHVGPGVLDLHAGEAGARCEALNASGKSSSGQPTRPGEAPPVAGRRQGRVSTAGRHCSAAPHSPHMLTLPVWVSTSGTTS